MKGNPMYPGIAQEEVATYTQKQKDLALLKWISKKPTEAGYTMLAGFFGMMDKATSEKFFGYVSEGIAECLIADNLPINQENVQEYLQPMLEAWASDFNELVLYWEQFVDEMAEREKPARLEATRKAQEAAKNAEFTPEKMLGLAAAMAKNNKKSLS